ncbi:uncharacterized protein G2W53_029265 [Senna tora]|uniref:Uncharacterized protein n=1 Tax=Senna tora TaxID=362788 RepID=A0A834T6X3_9FABA|nr:uncharacterized protein G2W53_029265 [Senna tora]
MAKGPRSTKKEQRELENARASKYKLYVYGYPVVDASIFISRDVNETNYS